jgi:hypothetical protein
MSRRHSLRSVERGEGRGAGGEGLWGEDGETW